MPTVDGRAKIKIAPGTHAGKVLRLGGKGLPDVNGYGRGDELVVVDITIPSKLSAEEKRLVEQLAQQPGFQHAESVKNPVSYTHLDVYKRQVPEVESARDEHADRGGAGITIVTFDLS